MAWHGMFKLDLKKLKLIARKILEDMWQRNVFRNYLKNCFQNKNTFLLSTVKVSIEAY